MKNIKTLLKSNRGATSVLIMVMMIILMVFGLAALTTSAVSKKLAQKNATWLKEYYQLRGQAEKFRMELEDGLFLEDPSLTEDRLEDRVESLMQDKKNFTYQMVDKDDVLYQIDAVVSEEDKEVPKSIRMQFLVMRGTAGYRLKLLKWVQGQAEIFSEDDELHFTDIEVKPEKMIE